MMGLDLKNTNTCCLPTAVSPCTNSVCCGGGGDLNCYHSLGFGAAKLNGMVNGGSSAGHIELTVGKDDFLGGGFQLQLKHGLASISRDENGNTPTVELINIKSSTPGIQTTTLPVVAKPCALSAAQFTKEDGDHGEAKQIDVETSLTKLYLRIYITPGNQEANSPLCDDSIDNFHPCIGCNARFLLSSTLLAHLRRRIAQINITCHFCRGANLVFHNGCALKQHLALHGITDLSEEDMIQNYSISIVPYDSTSDCEESSEMEISYTDNLRKNSCMQCGEFDNESPIVEDAEVEQGTSEAKLQLGQECHDHQDVENLSYPCNSCQGDFATLEQFCNHLKSTETDLRTFPAKSCSFGPCGFCTLSSCDLLFHENLFHGETKSPYLLCPDCGRCADSDSNLDWDYLLNHMEMECFHLNRVAQYKCQAFSEDVRPTCRYRCESSQDLIEHYRLKHTNLLRYCPLCSEIFTNAYLWLKHLKKKHSFNRDNYLQANACVIYQNQCECCLASFDLNECDPKISLEQFQQHLLSSQSVHYSMEAGYKCSSCCGFFATTNDLKCHQKAPCEAQALEAQESKSLEALLNPVVPSAEDEQDENSLKLTERRQCMNSVKGERGQRNEHSMKNSEFLLGAWRNLTGHLYRPNHLRSAVRREAKAPVSPSVRSATKQRCQHCHRIVDSNELTHHEKNCFYNSRGRCKTCFKTCLTKSALLEHGQQHIQEGYRICLFCQNLPMRDNERLSEHLKVIHTNAVKTFPFSCSICGGELMNKHMLELHFELHHSPSIMDTLEESNQVSRPNTEFPEAFPCWKCDQKFGTLRQLTIHVQFSH